MATLFSRENLPLLPRAARGLAEGFARYYIKPVIQDLGHKVLDKLNVGIPSQEELDAYITAMAAEELGSGE